MKGTAAFLYLLLNVHTYHKLVLAASVRKKNAIKHMFYNFVGLIFNLAFHYFLNLIFIFIVVCFIRKRLLESE